jgi:uncharacterized protein YndB with AHSA1/START domain
MPPQGSPRAIVEVSLDIATSPAVLWAAFTDMSKWPRWLPIVQSACCVAGTEWTLGAQFELALNLPFPAGRWRGIAKITEVQPAICVSWEKYYPLDVAVVHSYRLEPSNLGTLFAIYEAYYGTGSLIYRLSGFPGKMRQAFEMGLKKLKVYLEVGG